MKNLLLGLSLMMLCIVSCQQDDDFMTANPLDSDPIKTSFTGQVVDESNNPIAGADITLHGPQGGVYETNEYGYFQVKKKKVPGNGAYVSVRKEGFFHGSRTYYPAAGNGKMKIMLISKNPTGSVSSSTGGIVTGPENAIVDLPADGFVLSNGQSYSGTVEVAMKYLSADNSMTGILAPGDLRAINGNDEQVVLSSAGMLAVELSGSNGEALQLKDGKEATLTFPLNSALASNAPQSIPLWYFDEENGNWVEEGQAQLENGKYVGKVSHFSFWNCDIESEPATFTLTVLDDSGAPIEGLFVSLTFDQFFCGTGITDDQGVVSGFVPTGEVLTINISQSNCTSLYTGEIGPFSANENAMSSINLENIENIVLSGNLVNCNENDISSGMVEILAADGSSLNNTFCDSDGNFTINHFICNTGAISVRGIDLDDLIQSLEIPVNIALPAQEFTDLLVCDEVVGNFLSLTINGEQFNAAGGDASLYSFDNSTLFNYPYSEQDSLSFTIAGSSIGTFDLPQFYVENYWGRPSTTDVQATITEYGDVGEFVAGTIEGTFTQDSTSVDLPITGSFRAKRKQ